MALLPRARLWPSKRALGVLRVMRLMGRPRLCSPSPRCRSRFFRRFVSLVSPLSLFVASRLVRFVVLCSRHPPSFPSSRWMHRHDFVTVFGARAPDLGSKKGSSADPLKPPTCGKSRPKNPARRCDARTRGGGGGKGSSPRKCVRPLVPDSGRHLSLEATEVPRKATAVALAVRCLRRPLRPRNSFVLRSVAPLPVRP